MNTHTYEIVDGKVMTLPKSIIAEISIAALRHRHLQADVWGPGWAGYDITLPLSVNVRRRQHRLAQLERSQRDFERRVTEKSEAARKERERVIKWRKRRKWWSVWAVRGRPTEHTQVDVAPEQWVKPDWEMQWDGCSDLRFDIVWTIS